MQYSPVLMQCLVVVLSPLIAALLTGLGGRLLGKKSAHTLAIVAVFISLITSLSLAKEMFLDKTLPQPLDIPLYTWGACGSLFFQLGFLLDALTLFMMIIVTFVSLMVHIYTIGYMHDDPGYQRFFSYIALFTFAMLMLVMSNNFLQLFFGWEAVGVASYLLIGFWYTRESAIFANFKAFLVNRVSDFGFLLGIAAVLATFGTLDYLPVFQKVAGMGQAPFVTWVAGYHWSLITVIGLLLFIGAMGKSAQIPLHVWLPDSMEGPTPISALIHAATMVTAGIFMVARLSPLFEHSETTLEVMMVVGALTCGLMGLLGLVQNDIKRVIAYSTLSQLGYMVTALGASAYAVALFHLMTHAFFKALLFLGAGSVIVAMHHVQDMRHMGGLRRYMPITYLTMLIGSLALIGFPFFSGFYSKDWIIEAVRASPLPSARWVYWILLGSVLITALYTFRLFFWVFHGKERMTAAEKQHLSETPAVMWVPLVLLAIPSCIAGAWFLPKVGTYFQEAIQVLPEHPAMSALEASQPDPLAMALHGFRSVPFALGVTGILLSYGMYVLWPGMARMLRKSAFPLHWILIHKYGFDAFYQKIIAGGTRLLGMLCWQVGDKALVDGGLVLGSAKGVHWGASLLRRLQTGHLYHYVFVMITGVVGLLWWLLR